MRGIVQISSATQMRRIAEIRRTRSYNNYSTEYKSTIENRYPLTSVEEAANRYIYTAHTIQ